MLEYVSCSWPQWYIYDDCRSIAYVKVTDSGSRRNFNISGKQDEWNQIIKRKYILDILGASKIGRR